MNLKQYQKKNKIFFASLLLLLPFLAIFVSWPSTAQALGFGCTSDTDCIVLDIITCGAGNCYCDFTTSPSSCTPKKVDGASCTLPPECQSARCEGGVCGAALPAGTLGGSCTADDDCNGSGCTPAGTCGCASLHCALSAAGSTGDLGFACLSGGVCNRGDCATPGKCDCYEGSCRVIPTPGNLGAPCASGNRCAGIGCEAAGEFPACSCCDGICQIGACVTGMSGGTMTPVEFTSPIGQVSPGRFIGNAIKTVLGIIGAIALAIFVYGGFVWMTSGGSPEKIKTAQTTLVWAVLGMIVMFASYAAVDFVLRALGV